jgi:hypothetical protein
VTKVITAKFFEWQPEHWSREINPYLPHVHAVGNQMVELLPTMLKAFTSSSRSSNSKATAKRGKKTKPVAFTPEEQGLRLIELFAINTSRYLGQRREVRQMDWLEMGLESSKALADQKEQARSWAQLGWFTML